MVKHLPLLDPSTLPLAADHILHNMSDTRPIRNDCGLITAKQDVRNAGNFPRFDVKGSRDSALLSGE